MRNNIEKGSYAPKLLLQIYFEQFFIEKTVFVLIKEHLKV